MADSVRVMLEQGKKKRVVACAFEHHSRGESARSWALQFLIRRCTWHMLDHAWELEDRDLTNAPAA